MDEDQERTPEEWRGKDQRLGQLVGALLSRSASGDDVAMLAICLQDPSLEARPLGKEPVQPIAAHLHPACDCSMLPR